MPSRDHTDVWRIYKAKRTTKAPKGCLSGVSRDLIRCGARPVEPERKRIALARLGPLYRLPRRRSYGVHEGLRLICHGAPFLLKGGRLDLPSKEATRPSPHAPELNRIKLGGREASRVQKEPERTAECANDDERHREVDHERPHGALRTSRAWMKKPSRLPLRRTTTQPASAGSLGT